MNKFTGLSIVLVASLAFGTSAFARGGHAGANANAGAISSSTNNNNAQSGSMNAGVSQGINFNSAPANDHQTVYSTPSIGGQGFYGSFSPDSCTVSAGGGAAFQLVGLNIALPTDMKSCVLLRGFERSMQASATFQNLGDRTTAERLRQSAIDMLCQVSEQVKQALTYQGLCSDFSHTYAIAAPIPVLARGQQQPKPIAVQPQSMNGTQASIAPVTRVAVAPTQAAPQAGSTEYIKIMPTGQVVKTYR